MSKNLSSLFSNFHYFWFYKLNFFNLILWPKTFLEYAKNYLRLKLSKISPSYFVILLVLFRMTMCNYVRINYDYFTSRSNCCYKFIWKNFILQGYIMTSYYFYFRHPCLIRSDLIYWIKNIVRSSGSERL